MESAGEVFGTEGQSRTVTGRTREIGAAAVVPDETINRWPTTVSSVV
jgi:hypothetical protein